MATGNIFAVGFHVVFFGMTAVVKYGGTLELQLSSSSVKPSRIVSENAVAIIACLPRRSGESVLLMAE